MLICTQRPCIWVHYHWWQRNARTVRQVWDARLCQILKVQYASLGKYAWYLIILRSTVQGCTSARWDNKLSEAKVSSICCPLDRCNWAVLERTSVRCLCVPHTNLDVHARQLPDTQGTKPGPDVKTFLYRTLRQRIILSSAHSAQSVHKVHCAT